jgi:hypothetical protein
MKLRFVFSGLLLGLTINLLSLTSEASVRDGIMDFLGWAGISETDLRACNTSENIKPSEWLASDGENLTINLEEWTPYIEQTMMLSSSGVEDNAANLILRVDAKRCAKIKVYDWEEFSESEPSISMKFNSESDLVIHTSVFKYYEQKGNFVITPSENIYTRKRSKSKVPFWTTRLDLDILKSESGVTIKVFYFNYVSPMETQVERINLLAAISTALDQAITEYESEGSIQKETQLMLEEKFTNAAYVYANSNGRLAADLRSMEMQDSLMLSLYGSTFKANDYDLLNLESRGARELMNPFRIDLGKEFRHRFKYLCEDKEFVAKFGDSSKRIKSIDLLEHFLRNALDISLNESYEPLLAFLNYAKKVQDENKGTFEGVLKNPKIQAQFRMLNKKIEGRGEHNLIATPIYHVANSINRLQKDLWDIGTSRFAGFLKGFENVNELEAIELEILSKYQEVKRAIHLGKSTPNLNSVLKRFYDAESRRVELESLLKQNIGELTTFKAWAAQASKEICLKLK